ncbi:MAG: response regulator [Halorientalis sp.]
MGSPSARPPDGSSTILVAEDDTPMRASIEIWLADTGWDVITVENGQAAVEHLSPEIDVLVCDRRMPVLNASGVLDHLDDVDLDIPVIVLTAYEPDEDVSEDDVAAYLTKPVGKEVITSVIRRVLSARASN